MSIRRIAFTAFTLTMCAGTSRAGSLVTYDFIEGATASIGAKFTFDSPPASATTGWSTTDVAAILDLTLLDPNLGRIGPYNAAHFLNSASIGSSTGGQLDLSAQVDGINDFDEDLRTTIQAGTDASTLDGLSGIASGTWVLAPTAVPEPSSALMAGFGVLAGLAVWTWNRLSRQR